MNPAAFLSVKGEAITFSAKLEPVLPAPTINTDFVSRLRENRKLLKKYLTASVQHRKIIVPAMMKNVETSETPAKTYRILIREIIIPALSTHMNSSRNIKLPKP